MIDYYSCNRNPNQKTLFYTALKAIDQLQDEILFMHSIDNCDEATEQLIQQRQNVLVSILYRAKPLTGRGFFNVDKSTIISIIGAAVTYIIVLLQFNLSENGQTSSND